MLIKNKIILLLFVFNYLIANDVAYIRYFESDLNFKSNLSMLSTERRGLKHMAVSYDENDQPPLHNHKCILLDRIPNHEL